MDNTVNQNTERKDDNKMDNEFKEGNTPRLIVEYHVLENMPPNCINRDDTGNPKTAKFGGVTRSRSSSQCWKRDGRSKFIEKLGSKNAGIRTKKAIELIADSAKALDTSLSDEEAESKAAKAINNLGIKLDKSGKTTDALVFISPKQADALAELAVSGNNNKADYEAAMIDNPTIDQIMFGRMVAGKPSLKYDAAVSVSHAISTHAAPTECDLVVGLDDLSPCGSGSAFMGVNEFNSSTIYRYATVNVMEINRWFSKEETADAVAMFLESFLLAMPTGEGHSYGNYVIPDFIYVTIRTDSPINFAPAFENPVKSSGDGFFEPSVEAFKEYSDYVYNKVRREPDYAYICTKLNKDIDMGENVTLEQLLKNVKDKITELLP